jgi:hypothetical protein
VLGFGITDVEVIADRGMLRGDAVARMLRPRREVLERDWPAGRGGLNYGRPTIEDIDQSRP